MNIIQKFEQKQLAQLAEGKQIPNFRPGDTVRVLVNIVEGTTERKQAFEGVCIARRNRGVNSSFTVRKISNGEGVERVFPTYSPAVAGIELVRKGDVRRAKLYYMRGLTGKAARIKERIELTEEQLAKANEGAAAAEKKERAPKAVKAAKPKKAEKKSA